MALPSFATKMPQTLEIADESARTRDGPGRLIRGVSNLRHCGALKTLGCGPNLLIRKDIWSVTKSVIRPWHHPGRTSLEDLIHMDHPIKCAVVIAAGFGSRLRDGDDAGPKPLRRVESVPLLVRVLRCLAASGIEQAAVVLGYQADQIRAALEQETGLGLSLSYVLNEEYAKSNGVSVLAARQFVGQGCVLSMADHLYSPRVV